MVVVVVVVAFVVRREYPRRPQQRFPWVCLWPLKYDVHLCTEHVLDRRERAKTTTHQRRRHMDMYIYIYIESEGKGEDTEQNRTKSVHLAGPGAMMNSLMDKSLINLYCL